jgi:hypothetical protein
MAPCTEDIYLNLPGRYRLPKGKVLKLKKYIYGLRQSAYHWHRLFAKWLTNYGYENIDSIERILSRIISRLARMRITLVARTGAASQDGPSCSTEPWYVELKEAAGYSHQQHGERVLRRRNAVSQCGLDSVYLRRMLEQIMGYKQTRLTWIAQDNAACINLVKGAGMYNRAEHIDTRIYRTSTPFVDLDVSSHAPPCPSPI